MAGGGGSPRRAGCPSWRLVFICTVVCACIFSFDAAAVQLTIDKSECVYEDIQAEGDFITGSFVVYGSEHGWASDEQGMDVQVTAPHGYNVYSARKKTEDEFLFHASKKGIYKFCFTNHAPYPEMVVFNLHITHHMAKEDVAKDDHFIPIINQVTSLEEALDSVYSELIYLRGRDMRHKKTAESTNRRLIVKASVQAAALVASSVLQVYLLRRLFEKRLRVRV
ncbi:hypothetical protein CBR_g23987 [Chara braunii]|uniref:GOLD domain-containing protein n=1 Tax=Chara braunii TaxID=69332 RepID=A0A388L5M2_CHABU|nr:hypothetical protein CBR_g23987 [Chara braunii]|eukprot:GBG77542.1 hypothetical protein CBR_g23987 [Chara braunii]